MTSTLGDLGRRWFEEVWNQRRREAIGEMMIPDAVIHDGGTVARGSKVFGEFFDRMTSAFPNLHVLVEDTISEGEMLCVRWSSTGKHSGQGLGIDPTGITIDITGISIMRVSDGKFVEAWQNWDMLGMMQQLKAIGVAPTYIAATQTGDPQPV